MVRDDDEMKKRWDNRMLPVFYERADVVTIARELLGKILVTDFDQQQTAGRIVETEAYNGPFDKASHSYNNRRTPRTEIMYSIGGVAYVYLCYGIHHLFNVVTNVQNIPNAVLIRALEPLTGIDIMLRRNNKIVHDYKLTKGPGNVGKALGIHISHTGMSLQSPRLFITADGVQYKKNEIDISARIGVDYAAEDALLPYRFFVKDNRYVSGRKDLN